MIKEKIDFIHEKIRKWDAPALIDELKSGTPLEYFKINENQDVVLEAIHYNNDVVLKEALKRGWDVDNSSINYIVYAIKVNLELCNLLFNYSKDKILFLEKKEIITENTILHIAALMYKNNLAQIKWINQKTNLWNKKNAVGQTPMHFLIRDRIINEELYELISKTNYKWGVADDFGISCKDIVKSYSYDDLWVEYEPHQKIMKLMGLKT